ncbi:MAG TPA: hypothetical protein VG500_00105 [Gemmatimonadales bacterium]|jgi:hypothetical protein|nr:hypothetical protein [Gemmatimonadales bacterium]
MRRDDPAGEPLEEKVPLPAVAEQPTEALPARRAHLVTVVTRALAPGEAAAPGATLRERYWHPHNHRWTEADFDSLDALRRRHIDEGGWELLQEQRLEAPLAVEFIFKANRIDFTRPSREQILRDIGMTPDDVSHLLEHVDREHPDE